MFNGVGIQTIEAVLQPKIADRDDFRMTVIGPGDTDYTFPLSITRTVSSIWGVSDIKATAKELTEAIFNVSGTSNSPPTEGFWFDSYNSGNTVKETISKIYNGELLSFARSLPPNLSFIKSLGRTLFNKIDVMDRFFLTKYDIPFVRSLDEAFEYSQVVHDMDSPPKDGANFLYRVCVLSQIIDRLNFGKVKVENHTCSECGKVHSDLGRSSLNEFELWLANHLTGEKAKELVITFRMIRKLRNQYPIHEHFYMSGNARLIRKEIEEANSHFGLTKPLEYGRNWALVLNIFIKALDKINISLQ